LQDQTVGGDGNEEDGQAEEEEQDVEDEQEDGREGGDRVE
jgi:hypothetical protein